MRFGADFECLYAGICGFLWNLVLLICGFENAIYTLVSLAVCLFAEANGSVFSFLCPEQSPREKYFMEETNRAIVIQTNQFESIGYSDSHTQYPGSVPSSPGAPTCDQSEADHSIILGSRCRKCRKNTKYRVSKYRKYDEENTKYQSEHRRNDVLALQIPKYYQKHTF